ncbi:chaplin family protein [Streptomyces sp. NPDC086077]|uniref:chaplin n=1 Tax=Streptomyces sp. NPDC086077 TaxID=3154862 RepID=UPI00343FF84C
MKRVTRNSVFAVAAASGAMAMALPMSAAFAADGSSAEGVAAGSPGVASGNAIQIPVNVPVSICGNTVNVVGLLNPAAGNSCANKGAAKAAGSQDSTASEDSTTSEESTDSAASGVSGGASAQGLATDSPGLLSGNGIQLPIDLPVNVSGNSVNVVGLGNPVFGNSSVNGPGEPSQPPKTSTPNIPAPSAPAPSTPAKPVTPRSPALVPAQPGPQVEAPQLAHTGADLAAPAVAGTAALLVTGTILFRRFRPGQAR